jgi:hypothetical protein
MSEASICDAKTGKFIRLEDRGTPRCGEDFCDVCGDCLACYGGDDCYNGASEEPGVHVWVIYEEVPR